MKLLLKSTLVIAIFLSLNVQANSNDGTMFVFQKISQYEDEDMKLIIETEVNSCFLFYSTKNLIKIKMGQASDVIDYTYTNIKDLEGGDFKITLTNGDFLIITKKFEENINIFWYKEDIIIRLHKATQDISKIDCF